MWACCAVPKHRPRGQLPEGSSAIQMMESPLLCLESVLATWLSSSSTSWVPNTIVGILWGLGLYLLLLLFFASDPSSPPPSKKHGNIRKHHLESNGEKKYKKRSGSLKACREFLRDLGKIKDLLLLLRSHLRRLPDNGDSQMSSPEQPSEGSEAEPAGAQWPCREPEDSTAPAVGPSASLAPPATRSPPLASSCSPGLLTFKVCIHSDSFRSDSQSPELFPSTPSPSPPNSTDSEPCPPPPMASFVPPPSSTPTHTQRDSMALRVGTLPWSSAPYAHWLASHTRVISGVGRATSPVPAPSRCQADAKIWSLSTSSRCKWQQEHLPQHPPEVSFWGHPRDKQVEACSPSFVNPDTQKLRETRITRRTEQMWKENEKGDGSDHRLNCLGTVKSLGESTKGKPEQLASPGKPPDTKDLGDHLQQKCEQFFWGIPFLHSESLEANARESGSQQEIRSVSFNGHSPAFPFQFQATVGPHISPTQPLYQPVAPSQVLPQPAAPSQHNLECHSVEKQRESEQKTLPPMVKKTQVFSPVSPLPAPSTTYEEIEKTLGETLPDNGHASSEAPLTTQASRPPAQTSMCMSVGRMWHSEMAVRAHRASLEMSPGAATARSESGGESGGWASGYPHCRITMLEGSSDSPSSSADEDGGSVAAEEASAWKVTLKSSVLANSQIPTVDLRRSGTPGTNKIPTLPSEKGVIQDPEEPHFDAQHSDSELREKVESGKQPVDSGPGELLQDCDAHTLRQHSRAFLATDSSDSQSSLCSSQSTSSGDTSAAHVSGDITLSRWASHQSSQGLKESWRPEEPDQSQSKMSVPAGEEKHYTYSATCVAGAQLNMFSQLLEKPQCPLGEEAVKKEAIPSPVSPLPAPSPTYKEIEKTLGETLHDNGHASSEAPLTTQASRPPAQTSTCMSMGRMWHSEMPVRAHRASLELGPGAAMARSESGGESGGWATGYPHCRITVLEGSSDSPSSSADEDGGSLAAEEASAWKVTLKSSVPANSQIPNVDLRRSGTPGTNKIPTLPSEKGVIQDPEEPRLDAQHSDSELCEKVESGKQPADTGPGELLQDCDAHALRHHSRAFLATDSSDSQSSLCSSQSTSSGDTSAAHVSGDIMLSRWASHQSSQGLKGSWRPEEPDQSQSKMSVPAGEEKHCRRSSQGEHERRSAEPRASQNNGMLNKDKVTVESLRSKSCQLRQKEEQAPPESHLTKKRQHFPQGIFCSELPQQKGRPPSATAQSQGQDNSRSVPDSGAAEAQGIATASSPVGRILGEKIKLLHGCPPSELNWHKGQFQAPVGDHGATDFWYHRFSPMKSKAG
ncbi:spermatogenesis-associated protein 31E1-like isoform X2 [Manis javanica]|uniref:spermatogenesis-associated protein 31E1-like isoform X2 n=1 Tax=Manis javanica TaxID=9974 RepID=UPI003C6DABA4